MERITLVRPDGVDAGRHVPAVQVTADVERAAGQAHVGEVIAHRRTHFPAVSQTDVTAQTQVVGKLHLVVHLVVVERTTRSVGQRVVDAEAPGELGLDIAVFHVAVFVVAVSGIEFGILVRTVIVFLYRLQVSLVVCPFVAHFLSTPFGRGIFPFLDGLIADGVAETPAYTAPVREASVVPILFVGSNGAA